jgi:hypothetical protein
MLGRSRLPGVEIAVAEGGFIVSWMERRPPRPVSPVDPGYPRVIYAGVRYKQAVRVTLEEALTVAGKVLRKIEQGGDEVEADDEGVGEEYEAG